MAQINIEFDKAIRSSEEIIKIASRLKSVQSGIDAVKLDGILDGAYSGSIDRSIRKTVGNLADAAVKMESLGSALAVIANKYKAAEASIAGEFAQVGQIGKIAENISKRKKGTDKRNKWQKFWDWLFRREPDAYEATTAEQEQAADAAMRHRLWEILQDEKYSRENWDRASVAERKQILQDYMDEVIKAYGLEHVKHKIVWNNNATYTDTRINWGSYNHGSHKVSLNPHALTDSKGNWDSYELIGTVSHELRHAYQHEAVDHPTHFMVTQETIDRWEYGLDPAHYISSDKNFTAYYNQEVEVDARSFQVDRDGSY